jgi:hypothetical protein
MLAALCLTMLTCVASPNDAPPVSAVAAVYRARFVEAESQHEAQLRDLSREHPEFFTGFRETLFAMPVARVNHAVITVGDVTIRYRRYLMVALQQRDIEHRRFHQPFDDVLQPLIIPRLPLEIDQELLWQAAQRDLSHEELQRSIAWAEFWFDNNTLLRLHDELRHTGDPATELVETQQSRLAELRKCQVRERVTMDYLRHRALQVAGDGSRAGLTESAAAATAILRAERERAVIQTAYQLPPVEDPRTR